MQSKKSFLLATDLIPDHESSMVSVAAGLARGLNAQVHLLYVIEPLRHFENPALSHRYTQAQERFAEPAMEHLKQRLKQKHVSVGHSSIECGPVADSIVSAAAQRNAQFIVLGAGNVTAHRAVGLTASSVMEQAAQPVLVVHPELTGGTFRTILCPVDHSRVSLRGLRNAIRLAKIYEARLIVLSVLPEVSWLNAAAETGEITDVKTEYELQWCEELDRVMAGVSFEGVSHTLELERGVPHEKILTAARKYAADLIVMGATGRSGLVRVLLGSTTRRVLRDLPCSMLTVREQDLSGEES